MLETPPLHHDAAALLRCMAHPVRFAILARLMEGPEVVGTLVEALGVEQSALSHHLRTLRDAGLVAGDREGRHVRYRLDDAHVATIVRDTLAHAAERHAGDTP